MNYTKRKLNRNKKSFKKRKGGAMIGNKDMDLVNLIKEIKLFFREQRNQKYESIKKTKFHLNIEENQNQIFGSDNLISDIEKVELFEDVLWYFFVFILTTLKIPVLHPNNYSNDLSELNVYKNHGKMDLMNSDKNNKNDYKKSISIYKTIEVLRASNVNGKKRNVIRPPSFFKLEIQEFINYLKKDKKIEKISENNILYRFKERNLSLDSIDKIKEAYKIKEDNSFRRSDSINKYEQSNFLNEDEEDEHKSESKIDNGSHNYGKDRKDIKDRFERNYESIPLYRMNTLSLMERMEFERDLEVKFEEKFEKTLYEPVTDDLDRILWYFYCFVVTQFSEIKFEEIDLEYIMKYNYHNTDISEKILGGGSQMSNRFNTNVSNAEINPDENSKFNYVNISRNIHEYGFKLLNPPSILFDNLLFKFEIFLFPESQDYPVHSVLNLIKKKLKTKSQKMPELFENIVNTYLWRKISFFTSSSDTSICNLSENIEDCKEDYLKVINERNDKYLKTYVELILDYFEEDFSSNKANIKFSELIDKYVKEIKKGGKKTSRITGGKIKRKKYIKKMKAGNNNPIFTGISNGEFIRLLNNDDDTNNHPILKYIINLRKNEKLVPLDVHGNKHFLNFLNIYLLKLEKFEKYKDWIEYILFEKNGDIRNINYSEKENWKNDYEKIILEPITYDEYKRFKNMNRRESVTRKPFDKVNLYKNLDKTHLEDLFLSEKNFVGGGFFSNLFRLSKKKSKQIIESEYLPKGWKHIVDESKQKINLVKDNLDKLAEKQLREKDELYKSLSLDIQKYMRLRIIEKYNRKEFGFFIDNTTLPYERTKLMNTYFPNVCKLYPVECSSFHDVDEIKLGNELNSIGTDDEKSYENDKKWNEIFAYYHKNIENKLEYAKKNKLVSDKILRSLNNDMNKYFNSQLYFQRDELMLFELNKFFDIKLPPYIEYNIQILPYNIYKDVMLIISFFMTKGYERYFEHPKSNEYDEIFLPIISSMREGEMEYKFMMEFINKHKDEWYEEDSRMKYFKMYIEEIHKKNQLNRLCPNIEKDKKIVLWNNISPKSWNVNITTFENSKNHTLEIFFDREFKNDDIKDYENSSFQRDEAKYLYKKWIREYPFCNSEYNFFECLIDDELIRIWNNYTSKNESLRINKNYFYNKKNNTEDTLELFFENRDYENSSFEADEAKHLYEQWIEQICDSDRKVEDCLIDDNLISIWNNYTSKNESLFLKKEYFDTDKKTIEDNSISDNCLEKINFQISHLDLLDDLLTYEYK